MEALPLPPRASVSLEAAACYAVQQVVCVEASAAAPPLAAVPATLMQHHAGKRLLVVAQRCVEGLEGVSEGLHLLGALLLGRLQRVGTVGLADTMIAEILIEAGVLGGTLLPMTIITLTQLMGYLPAIFPV